MYFSGAKLHSCTDNLSSFEVNLNELTQTTTEFFYFSADSSVVIIFYKAFD